MHFMIAPDQSKDLPFHQSAEGEAHIIVDHFLTDLPGAFEAAENLVAIDNGPLTADEISQGLSVTKLGTGAFFESYDPTRDYRRARNSGPPTLENVGNAALHARNTLYMAVGVYHYFPGYRGEAGDNVPAGLVVLGRDDENSNALCAYVYSVPDYTSGPDSDGYTKLTNLMGRGGRKYWPDSHNSR